MGEKKEIYRDVRFFLGALQLLSSSKCSGAFVLLIVAVDKSTFYLFTYL